MVRKISQKWLNEWAPRQRRQLGSQQLALPRLEGRATGGGSDKQRSAVDVEAANVERVWNQDGTRRKAAKRNTAV